MPDVNVKECLAIWREKYGEDRVPRSGVPYKAIPQGLREELLIIFLRWMRMLGLTKEYFEGSNFKTQFVDTCVGKATWSNKDSKDKAKFAVLDQLEKVLMVRPPFGKVPNKGRQRTKPTPTTLPEYDPSIHTHPFKEVEKSDLHPSMIPTTELDPLMSDFFGIKE